MTKQTALSLALFSILLTACSKPHDDSHYETHENIQYASVATNATQAEQATDAAAINEPSASPQTTQPQTQTDQTQELSQTIAEQSQNSVLVQKPLIIKGDLRFEVDSVRQTVNYIQALTNSHSGYIASETIQNEQGRTERVMIGDGQFKEIVQYTPTAHLSVRVPNKELGAFLQNLQTRVVFLVTSDMNAKDASLDIKKAQLEAQIAQLKAQALNNIDSQGQSAGVMNAKVTIAESTALARLEAAYAELSEKAVADEVAYATVHLNIFEQPKLHTYTIDSIKSRVASERRGSFSGRLKDNLAIGWSYALEFVLVLARFWVFLAVLGFVLFGIPKIIKFSKRKKANTTNPPPIYVPANPNNNQNNPPNSQS